MSVAVAGSDVALHVATERGLNDDDRRTISPWVDDAVVGNHPVVRYDGALADMTVSPDVDIAADTDVILDNGACFDAGLATDGEVIPELAALDIGIFADRDAGAERTIKPYSRPDHAALTD